MTLEEAIAKFIDHAKKYDKNAPNNHWYVGITYDLENRKYQHENEKGIECKYFESLVNTTDRDIALKLEGMLEKVGFAKTTKDLEPLKSNASAMVKETAKTTDSNAQKTHIYIYQAVELK